VYNATIDYSFLSKLQHEIGKKEYIIADTQYLDTVTLKIIAEPHLCEALREDLIQWTNGGVLIQHLGTEVLRVDEASGKII
jgi:putative IMPACT (imprinted ancient) family translation regulator